MDNTKHNNKMLLLGGPQRFLTQYSAAVPQNLLVSILQGAVFALLITQPLQLPRHFSVNVVITLLLQHHLYLLSIVSVLIILIVWQIFVFNSLLFILPPTFLVSGLIFLLTAAEAIMVKSIDNFSMWMVFAGVVQVVGGIFRCYTRRLLTPQDFERRILGRIVLSYEFHYGVKYIILGSVGVVLGLGYDNLLVLLEKVYTPQLATDVLQWSMSLLALLNIVAVIIADKWYKHDIYRVMSRTIARGGNGLVRGNKGLPLRRKKHIRGKHQTIPPAQSSLPLEGEAGKMLELFTAQSGVIAVSNSAGIDTGDSAQQCLSLDEDKSCVDEKKHILETEA
jgi:hypothetical protein